MNSEHEPSQALPAEAADELPRSKKKAAGYGKPPTQSQFTKGKSGNPRGRPIRDRSLQESARWALGQKIRVTEAGAVYYLSIQEVILRKCAQDPRKARFLFELAWRDARFRPRSPDLDELIRIKKAHQEWWAHRDKPRTAEECEEFAREYKRSFRIIESGGSS